jgi:hypothetical protein
MSNINTGGPAFPGLNPEFTGISSDGQERYEIQPSGGMTLRDYFAAKAMQAVCAPSPTTGQYPQKTEFQWSAETAYALADAMLKARQA